MDTTHPEVRLLVPAMPEFIRLARLAAAALASRKGFTYDEVLAGYHEAAAGLLEGGADLILLETQQDTINIKASINGVHAAYRGA